MVTIELKFASIWHGCVDLGTTATRAVAIRRQQRND
jgi:hypothetical protein